MATSSSEPHATPSLEKSAVVVSSFTQVDIKASVDQVFGIICDNENYREWNTWCPKFSLPEGQKFEVGSTPTLLCKMEAQKREYQVPVKILELSSSPEKSRIAWQSAMLPSWVATIERVQEIEPLPQGGGCRIRNWESMGGWGAYVMKYLMRIEGQLTESNLQYVQDLKGMAERL